MNPALVDIKIANLRKAKAITHGENTVLLCLLWRLRSRRRDRTQVSIDAIMAKSGACRDTVVRAVGKGVALGIFRKVRSTTRRAIGAYVRTVNWINTYVFLDPNEKNIPQSAWQTTPLKAQSPDLESVPRAGAETAIDGSEVALPPGRRRNIP